MTFFQVLWFILIFVLIGGYFVLDGFDLGAGALYPFVAKNDKEKAIVRRSIGPVWDGNEVWLLTAGGALFADDVQQGQIDFLIGAGGQGLVGSGFHRSSHIHKRFPPFVYGLLGYNLVIPHKTCV